VSFKMSFRKARERTPANRDDFQDCEIALVNDQWECSVSGVAGPSGVVSPKAQKHLEALRTVLEGDQTTVTAGGRAAAPRAAWEGECIRSKLIDPAKPSARVLFNKYRKELADAHLVAVDGDLTWLAT
jgi:hypothetical protein